MKKVVYFHCGAPKTGTSYIQHLIALNRQMLLENSIYYPESKYGQGVEDPFVVKSGNAIELAHFLRPNDVPHAVKNESSYLDAFSECLSKGFSKVLFSSEHLLFPCSEKSKYILDACSKAGYEFKFLYFVRSYYEYARSSYSQDLKKAAITDSFLEYIKGFKFSFAGNIKALEDLCGRKPVEVYSYDEHSARLGEFFFHDLLNVQLDLRAKLRVNRSLSSKEIECLLFINRLRRNASPKRFKDKFVSNYISELLIKYSVVNSSSECVDADALNYIVNNCADDMEYVNSFVRGEKILASVNPCGEASSVQYELSDFEKMCLASISSLIASRRPS